MVVESAESPLQRYIIYKKGKQRTFNNDCVAKINKFKMPVFMVDLFEKYRGIRP